MERSRERLQGPPAIASRLGYAWEQRKAQRRLGPPPGWAGTPPKDTEVHFSRIPRDCNEDDLFPIFSRVKTGVIYEMRLIMDLYGFNRGYGFLRYTSREAALEAVKLMDGFQMGEYKIRVALSVDNNRLFVGALPRTANKEDVFRTIGERVEGLQDVILHSDRVNKALNRGFAFLVFESHAYAAEARRVILPNPETRLGRLTIDWAEPEPRVDEKIMNEVKVLYFSNLSSITTEQSLKQAINFMISPSIVLRVKKVEDYAFAHFEKKVDAERAMYCMDKTVINGAVINVEWSRPIIANEQSKAKLCETVSSRTWHPYEDNPNNPSSSLTAEPIDMRITKKKEGEKKLNKGKSVKGKGKKLPLDKNASSVKNDSQKIVHGRELSNETWGAFRPHQRVTKLADKWGNSYIDPTVSRLNQSYNEWLQYNEAFERTIFIQKPNKRDGANLRTVRRNDRERSYNNNGDVEFGENICDDNNNRLSVIVPNVNNTAASAHKTNYNVNLEFGVHLQGTISSNYYNQASSGDAIPSTSANMNPNPYGPLDLPSGNRQSFDYFAVNPPPALLPYPALVPVNNPLAPLPHFNIWESVEELRHMIIHLKWSVPLYSVFSSIINEYWVFQCSLVLYVGEPFARQEHVFQSCQYIVEELAKREVAKRAINFIKKQFRLMNNSRNQ